MKAVIAIVVLTVFTGLVWCSPLIANKIRPEKDFSSVKPDGIGLVALHPPGHFPTPHMHMRMICGDCGNVSDVILWNAEGKIFGASFNDREMTRKTRLKIGFNPACFDKCRLGNDMVAFGEEKRNFLQ